jgi:hypothetical protein
MMGTAIRTDLALSSLAIQKAVKDFTRSTRHNDFASFFGLKIIHIVSLIAFT